MSEPTNDTYERGRDWNDVLEHVTARHNSRVRHLHAEGIELVGGEDRSLDRLSTCERCGHVAPSAINLWAHRHRFDLFSECDRRLIRRWLPWKSASLQTGNDRSSK